MLILLFPLLLQDEPIRELIEKLGADSVEQRDDADRLLRLRAGEAEDALREAARNPDAEVAARAGALLDQISAWRNEVAGELFLLLNHARSEFDDGHFDHCARICDLALALAPGLPLLEGLRRDALEGCWRPGHGGLGQTVDLRWIRLPTPAVWTRLKDHIRRDYPEDEWGEVPVHRKLATLRMDLDFENTTVEDILAFVRDYSGLNLVVDAGLPEAIDLTRKIDLRVKDQTVEGVLRCLGAELGLVCLITEERVLLLTTPRRAAGRR